MVEKIPEGELQRSPNERINMTWINLSPSSEWLDFSSSLGAEEPALGRNTQ